MHHGFGGLDLVTGGSIKFIYLIVELDQVGECASEVAIVDARAHFDSVSENVVDHTKLPRDEEDGGYEGEWVALADTAGDGKRLAVGGAELDSAVCVA